MSKEINEFYGEGVLWTSRRGDDTYLIIFLFLSQVAFLLQNFLVSL